MPRADPTARYLKLSQPELERQVALRYEQGLIELQQRMHPEAFARPSTQGVVIHAPPGMSASPGEGESPEELAQHGRRVAQAMFEAVRDEICGEMRERPQDFRTPRTAVRRLVHHVTRTSPPDEMFVAAACWLWREGLSSFCEGPGGGR